MALGVLNNLSAIYAENNLNNTNASLQTVLQQLSSGSRINSGADDAAGLSLVNGLAANSAALTQSETNATEGVGLLQVADGALSQVTSLLNRAITLATEASNGTLDTAQDAAANQEYQSILSEVNNIGSTTTYNQVQVFDGNTVAIYTGDSSQTGSSVDDLSIRSLSASSVGDTGGTMSYSSGQNNVFLNLSTSTANAAATDTLNGGASGTTTVDVNYLVNGASGSSTTATAAITVGRGTSYANTANGLIQAISDSGLGLTAIFATQAQAGVQGGGSETGIEIAGGAVSVGVDPNSVSTSGILNPTGITAAEVLTNGQTVTVAEGGVTKATVIIGTTPNVSGGGFVNTLSELVAAINSQAGAGTASVITNGDGTQSLSVADASEAGGALTVSTTAGANVAPAFIGADYLPGANSTSIQSTPNADNVAGVESVTPVDSSITVGAPETSTTLGSTVLSAGGSITIQNTIPNDTTSVTFVVGAGTDVSSGANQVYYTANSGGNSNTLANLAATINATAGATLNVTASVGTNGGLVVAANTASASETVSTTANSLSAATNTIGLYTPTLTQIGEYATAQLQLNDGDDIGGTDALTGSFTLTNDNISTTYVIGNGTNGGGTFYTGTTSETSTALATFIGTHQTAGMDLDASVGNGGGAGTGAIILQSQNVMVGGGGGITFAQGSTTTGPLADSVAMYGGGNVTSKAGVAQIAGNNASIVVGPGSGTVNTGDTITGQITITNGGTMDTFIMAAGANNGNTFYTDNTANGGTNYGETLAGLAQAINADSNNDVTALAGTDGLTLTQNGTTGNYSGGSITVGTAGTGNTLVDTTQGGYSQVTLGGFASASDTVSGTLFFSVGTGNGSAKSLTLTSGETLAQMVDQIDANSTTGQDLGVTAQLVSGVNGAVGVQLTSNTIGTAGNITPNLAATSTVADTATTANLSYTATNAYSTGVSGSVSDSTTSAAASFVADSKSGSGVATISYADGAGASLADTDLSNPTGAEATLTALNAAISDVAAQDGYIGAQINTLNSISQVMSTQQENVVSAQNAIQATDYASATSNMSKYEILSQTGIAALAQANSVQQEVTKLLQ